MKKRVFTLTSMHLCKIVIFPGMMLLMQNINNFFQYIVILINCNVKHVILSFIKIDCHLSEFLSFYGPKTHRKALFFVI